MIWRAEQADTYLFLDTLAELQPPIIWSGYCRQVCAPSNGLSGLEIMVSPDTMQAEDKCFPQMLSSALVATQVDAGSAAQVPAVLAQLRNATDRGQLQASHSASFKHAPQSLHWPLHAGWLCRL